jgi:hypothetical protein
LLFSLCLFTNLHYYYLTLVASQFVHRSYDLSSKFEVFGVPNIHYGNKHGWFLRHHDKQNLDLSHRLQIFESYKQPSLMLVIPRHEGSLNYN